MALNLSTILFVSVMFTIGKGMILADINDTAPQDSFPVLEFPDLDFEEIPASCGGFTDCIEYVGNILKNAVLGIVWTVLFFFYLTNFMRELLVLMADNAFTGIDGAPFWLNAMLQIPIVAAIGIIIFKMARKGDSNAA